MSDPAHAGPSDPTYIHPHLLTGANPSHFTPLPSDIRAHLRQFSAFFGMAGSGSYSDHSGSADWGVILCGLEDAMAARIALRRSREDSIRPMDGSVRRDAIGRLIGRSGPVMLDPRGPGSQNTSGPKMLHESTDGSMMLCCNTGGPDNAPSQHRRCYIPTSTTR